MTPNNSIAVGLTEINNIVREENSGKAVVQPPTDEINMAGKDLTPAPSSVMESTARAKDGLNDTDLAKNLLAQAKGYETEAKSLKAQAYDLAPGLKPGPKKAVAKTEPEVETASE